MSAAFLGALLSVLVLSGCDLTGEPESEPATADPTDTPLRELAALSAFLSADYENVEPIEKSELPNRPRLIAARREKPNRVQAVEGIRADLPNDNSGFVHRYASQHEARAGASSQFGLTEPWGYVSGCGKNVFFTSNVRGREAERWTESVSKFLNANDSGCKGSQFAIIE